MNKKLLAVAVAAALTPFAASAADVTFSGTIRGALDMTNVEDSNGKKNDMLVGINRARLRADVKQALDGGMTMSGYIRMDRATNNVGDIKMDQQGVYLSGGFGDFGIQGVGDSGNFGDTLGHMDIFEGPSPVGGFNQGNSSPNTLWYSSPDMGGLKFKLAVLTDNTTTTGVDGELPQGTNFDVVNPRVTYIAGPLKASVGVNIFNSTAYKNEDATRTNIGASYKMDNITAGVSYEMLDTGLATNNKETVLGLSAQADLGSIGVRVAMGKKGGDVKKGTDIAAGVDFKLGKGAKAFAEINNQNADWNGGGTAKSSATQQVGLRLDF